MKKVLTGIVTSDKCDKTRRVEIERRFRHAMYGKIVRGRTVCHVHDENNESHRGDLVEIVECRPRSKQKRWELVRIVAAAEKAEVEAAQAAEAIAQADGQDN